VWDCWKFEDLADFVNACIHKDKSVSELVEIVLNESIQRAVANFGAKHYDDACVVILTMPPNASNIPVTVSGARSGTMTGTTATVAALASTAHPLALPPVAAAVTSAPSSASSSPTTTGGSVAPGSNTGSVSPPRATVLTSPPGGVSTAPSAHSPVSRT